MNHFIKAGLHRGMTIINSYFKWMIKYSKHPDKYPLEKRFNKLRNMVIRVSEGFDVDFYVTGQENIPNESCFIVSNHLSSFDPLALITIFDKPTSFVAKKEALKMPFVGKCCKAIECEMIDRKDLKNSLKAMLSVEEDLKAKNKNWIIFPEGTRAKDPNKVLNEFHHGTFRPAIKSEVPIVPIALYGTHAVFKNKPRYKRYPVLIKVLKPIYPSEYKSMNTKDLAKLCQSIIQKEITFNLRPSYLGKLIKK